MGVRGAMLILAALALGACGNTVKSEKPLFSSVDEAGAPTFKQGVWIGEDPKCPVDESRPQETWPTCADPFELGPDGLKDPKLLEGPDSRVVAGDPLILQMGDQSGFNYLAVSVTKQDRRGRVTAFRSWPVLCGPPPRAPPGESPSQKVTLEPMPGLKIRGDDCFATDPDVVRRAATASEAWNEEIVNFHWVRKGRP